MTGAQQRLLALTLTVGAARTQIHDPHQLTLIETIRQELHCTLRELRELAHGIHPAVLTQAGLGSYNRRSRNFESSLTFRDGFWRRSVGGARSTAQRQRT